MTYDEFLKFIDKQDAFFKENRKHSEQSEREHILARTVKISEEFGELCDEVLASFGSQRSGKMENRKREDLEDEFADVVITVFLLAKNIDVNIMEALERKTKQIQEKHNKQLKL
jgi:NTP pyrophosphatase (non-canonical NTP hydrolase)